MGKCSIYPEETWKCDNIIVVHRTFSALSMVGSFSIAVLIILLRQQKMVIQRMILFMAISAFLVSTAYLIRNAESPDNHACQFQSFMMQYFDWATVLWVFMISINSLLIVKNKSKPKYYLIYHAVVWLGALTLSVIPFIENAYGHAGLWCWIKKDYPEYRFGVWYGPLMALCVAMFCIFFYVVTQVYQNTKAQSGHSVGTENMNKRYRNELRPLLFYPLIYVVFSIPTFIYRIDDVIDKSKPPNYALMIIAAISAPSKGTANAIIFAIVNLQAIRELTWRKLKNHVLLYYNKRGQAQITHNIELQDNTRSEVSHQTTSNIVPNVQKQSSRNYFENIEF